jgi:hypothetical protein
MRLLLAVHAGGGRTKAMSMSCREGMGSMRAVAWLATAQVMLVLGFRV